MLVNLNLENLEHLNSHFLGFELLVPGTHDFGTFSKAIETPGTYTEEQFKTSLEVCQYWMNNIIYQQML